jgi:hypothetical protein
VQDPCYNQYTNTSNNPPHALYTGDNYKNYAMGTSAPTSPTAGTTGICPAVDVDTIQDQSNWSDLGATDPHAVPLATGKTGWKIGLDAAVGTAGGERVLSDVTAAFNGVVFYTTYTPNSNVCIPGGTTSMWAVYYNTGNMAPPGSLKGKAPLQTSSGSIKLIDLGTAFTLRAGRKLDAGLAPVGMAPKNRFPPLLSPKPSKLILHIQEK